MSSTATTTVKTKQRPPSSASQKFWPLKKFGLHHGKTEEQQSIPLSLTTTKEPPTPVEPTNDIPIEKDAQKKTKNKRLSSLLLSRRQEASNNNFQNLKSHVNTPESIAADNTKKQINNASNTPTLTRKTGREISSRTRTTSQNITANTIVSKNNNVMTAKSAGSGALARNNTLNSTTTPSASPLINNKARTRELRNNSIRRSSEDKLLKRPQSPPSKRNNSPTQQPNIMLESVQQQIQQEQLTKDDVDNDSAIEEDNNEDDENEHVLRKDTNDKIINQGSNIELDEVEINKKKQETPLAELKHDTKEEEEKYQNCLEEKKNTTTEEKRQTRSPLLSPPTTPAATEIALPELSIGDSSDAETSITASGMINVHSEPVSPTMCTFDVLSIQKLNEIDKQNVPNNSFVQQQPIQRIHRLRPAASFATLRQLASTNTYQLQQQLQHQQQLTPQQVQQQTTKRRPVSYIESSNNAYFNCANNDDYLTVNRPNYYRRASSEDNRHFHTRHQSDNNTPSIQHHVGSRRLVRSNTVHNLIIKDGLGHRIVQCVGLDEPPQSLRKKTSNLESVDLFQHQDWSSPPETSDDVLFATRQQKIEEQQYHQQQLLIIQQQQQQAHIPSIANDNTLETSSSDSSSHRVTSNRRIRRKDSAKSISSLCSGSPPSINYDSRFKKLKTKLDKERATVKALQKQKEACNKDVVFLSKNVDNLTTENIELKKRLENEKTLKERFQDDLSSTMEMLSEATEQIRQLESQTKILKLEIDDKNKEIREFEKKKQQPTSPLKTKPYSEGKSADRLLASQLAHSQNQVRLLKSTMEQFLRMGVFNDDLNSSSTSLTSPTTSFEAMIPDFKCVGKSRQRRSDINKSTTTTCTAEDVSTSTTSPTTTSKSKKSKVPTENPNVPNKATKTPEKKLNQLQDEATVELDIQLRELLREKEILQAEYSKAPSSGGNALVRRRREELESRLDTVDSQMYRIKLKMRSRNIL